jgi:hypothetical protein
LAAGSVIESSVAKVGTELEGVSSACPSNVVAELTASLDVVVQIATANRRELLGAGLHARKVEVDGPETQDWSRKKCEIVLLGERDPGLAGTREAAVMAYQPEPHLIDQVRRDDVHICECELHGVVYCRRSAAEKTRKDANSWCGEVALREASVEGVLCRDGVVDADVTLVRIRKLGRLVEEIA